MLKTWIILLVALVPYSQSMVQDVDSNIMTPDRFHWPPSKNKGGGYDRWYPPFFPPKRRRCSKKCCGHYFPCCHPCKPVKPVKPPIRCLTCCGPPPCCNYCGMDFPIKQAQQ